MGQVSKEDLRRQTEAVEAAYGAQAAPEEPDSRNEVVPTVITDRMMSRAITFAGLPIVFGLLLFPCFWYAQVRASTLAHFRCPSSLDPSLPALQKVLDISLPLGAVFGTQSLCLVLGLVGISYGATSASWDPSREGSKLGWTEFRANLSAVMAKGK